MFMMSPRGRGLLRMLLTRALKQVIRGTITSHEHTLGTACTRRKENTASQRKIHVYGIRLVRWVVLFNVSGKALSAS